jgi:sporulation protein YlmC with PRC-barrel domain
MRLSELLSCEVRDEAGESLGHVFDVRVARDPRSRKGAGQQWHLTGLLVGRRGLLQRFGFSHSGPAGPRHKRDAIPWNAVLGIKRGVITVRSGTEPQ